MDTLTAMLSDVRINDALIQRVLRAIDPEMFKQAMVGMPEASRKVFLRNMSVRANEAVLAYIKSPEAADGAASARAQEGGAKILARELH